MTRDPVDAAEIEHDLASQKGMDVDAVERRIVYGCEDCNPDHDDWVNEPGRDPVAFQLELRDLAFDTLMDGGEAMARIKQLFRKEFQFYAQKRAERERE